MDEPSNVMPVVVLTGGIASGKTAVANQLQALGACIIDTDEIARALSQPGQRGFDAIVGQWGERFVVPTGPHAGSIDRAKLRQAIFDDSRMRATLEGLLHPLIVEQVKCDLARCANDRYPYAVVVIPLYAETQLEIQPQAVVVVDAPEELQKARLMSRDHINETLANHMIAAQASREARLQLATHVITNDSTYPALEKATLAIHQSLIEQFANPQSH